jgi:electron transfer flavoprotein beta subunit
LGIDAGEVGEGGAKIQVVELTPPAERAAGKLVEGETPEEKAANLATLLREEAKAI